MQSNHSSERWNDIPIVHYTEENPPEDSAQPGSHKRVYANMTIIDWSYEYAKERETRRLMALSSHERGVRNSYKWIVLIATGSLIGLLSASSDYLYRWLVGLKDGRCTGGKFYMTFDTCCKGILEGDECQDWNSWGSGIQNEMGSSIYRYFVYIIGSLILSSLAGLIVLDVPFVRTSGIAEVKAIISGVVIEKVMGYKTLIAKFIGLILVVGSGLWAGKEGPLVHISCAITNILIEFFPMLRENEAIKRELLVASTAAAISAAFDAPISGVIFTFEQIVSYFSASDKMWSSFVCSMCGVVVINFFKETTDILVTMDNQWLNLEILGFIILGLLGGLFGACFNKLNMMFAKFRKEKISSRGSKFDFLELIALSLITSMICYPLIFPRLSLSSLMTRLYKDCVSTEADSIIGGLCDSNSDPIWKLLLTSIVSILLTSYTFGTMIPAGVLLPSLTIGALVGRLLGIFVEKLQNKHPLLASLCENTDGLCISPGAYAVIGSAAFLAGVTKMTVWVVITVFEITGALTYVLPIMLTVLIARWVSDRLEEKNCYDLWIRFLGYPYLNEISKPLPLIPSRKFMKELKDLEVIYLEDDIKLNELERLLELEFQGVPILTSRSAPKVHGWLSLSDLRKEFERINETGSGVLDKSMRVLLARPLNDDSVRPAIDPQFEYPLYNIVEWRNEEYILSSSTPLPTLVDIFSKMKPRFVLFTNDGLFQGLLTLRDIDRLVEES